MNRKQMQHYAGCLLVALACAHAVPTPASAADVRIACIGDSITFGAGVENAAVNAYPVVLDRLLGTGFEVRNFGVSGATLLRKGDLPYWSRGEFRAATNYNPNIVIIKLGTNDSKPQNWQFKQDFAPNLREMVDLFSNLPSKPRVWLCLPVPAYAVQFGIRPEVIQFETLSLIQQVATEKQCPVIDLFSALSHRPDLFPDQIHPNAAGAALMARSIHAALVAGGLPPGPTAP